MKYFKAVISLIAFGLFFVWAVDFDMLRPFKMFFPAFHIIIGISLILVSAVYLSRIELTVTEKFKKFLFIFFPASALVISLVINYTFFQQMPHIQDSINYLAIAQNFAKGQLHSIMPEHYEFFTFLYMIPDGEKFYSLFLPGFSIFLTPFVILKVPFLANPLLTAFNVWISGKIAKTLFNENIAIITMFFLLLSSFMIVMGGTFMAHSFCAAMTLSAVYCYILSINSTNWKYPALAGASIGWLTLIRPQNAVFLAVPLALYSLIKIREKGTISKGLILAASFLPFLALLLVYNWIYTGNPLIFKQDVYFNYAEPSTLCHRFGIGTGCPNSNWIEMPKEGLTWSHAVIVSYRRLSPLVVNLLLHPLTLFFAIFAFIFAKTKSDFLKLVSLFILFLASFTGYFFFYFDGNVFGPRYLYEVSYFLIIIIAYGFNFACSLKFVKIPVVSLMAGAFIFQLGFIYPELYHSYEKGFWDVDAKLGSAVKAAKLKNAVVFVSPHWLSGSGFALMDTTDIGKNDIIYAKDLGEKQNRRLMFEYPERNFYLAKFKKINHNTEPPDITKLNKEIDTGEIHVELEGKNYPLKGVPDYCNFFPEKAFMNKYLEMEPPYKYLVSDQTLFFCRFKRMDQFYTFGQKFNFSANYKTTIRVLSGPQMGNFKLFLDDKFAGLVQTNSKEEKMIDIPFDIKIEKGYHFFRLQPESLVSTYNYFFIDYIDFIPEK